MVHKCRIQITFYIQDEQKGSAHLCKNCFALCLKWECHVCPGTGPFATAPSAGSNFAIDTVTKPLTTTCALSSIVFTTDAKLIFSQPLYGSHRQLKSHPVPIFANHVAISIGLLPKSFFISQPSI